MRQSRLQISPFVLILALGLAACGAPTEIDSAKAERASLSQRLEANEAKIAELQKEIADLKSTVYSVNNRLSSLQTASVQEEVKKASTADAGRVEAIKVAISQCVRQVRANPNQGAFDMVLPAFDAYYNPATGQVQDNLSYAQQKPARYAFNKCMAARGFVVKQ